MQGADSLTVALRTILSAFRWLHTNFQYHDPGIRQQKRQTQLSSHSVDKRLVFSRDVPGRDRRFFPAAIKPAQAIKRAALLTLLERRRAGNDDGRILHLRWKARDVFEKRYHGNSDPQKDRLELCSRVLARLGVVYQLSEK